MKYDFVTMPDRRGMDSIAVDMQDNDFWKLPQGETLPGFDKIPMWIADMNFNTAPSSRRLRDSEGMFYSATGKHEMCRQSRCTII